MNIPRLDIRRSAEVLDLGLSGADKNHADRVKAAFTEAWRRDANEIMEAAAVVQISAPSCAEQQASRDPISPRFAACLTGRGEPKLRWQRYLNAIQMIDALQHGTGSRGLPDHRFFADIAGDWSL